MSSIDTRKPKLSEIFEFKRSGLDDGSLVVTGLRQTMSKPKAIKLKQDIEALMAQGEALNINHRTSNCLKAAHIYTKSNQGLLALIKDQSNVGETSSTSGSETKKKKKNQISRAVSKLLKSKSGNSKASASPAPPPLRFLKLECLLEYISKNNECYSNCLQSFQNRFVGNSQYGPYCLFSELFTKCNQAWADAHEPNKVSQKHMRDLVVCLAAQILKDIALQTPASKIPEVAASYVQKGVSAIQQSSALNLAKSYITAVKNITGEFDGSRREEENAPDTHALRRQLLNELNLEPRSLMYKRATKAWHAIERAAHLVIATSLLDNALSCEAVRLSEDEIRFIRSELDDFLTNRIGNLS